MSRLLNDLRLFVCCAATLPFAVGCMVSFSPSEQGDAAVDASGFCGDGVLNGAESCDGTDLGGETCESLEYKGGALECDESCLFDTSGCISSICGDGLIEGDEVCDGVNLAGETCETQGRGSGTLKCLDDCSSFDYSGCQRGDGEPCTEGGVCAGGICYEELDKGFSGGYCTRDCSNDDCPDGSVCVQLLEGFICLKSCATTGDCRVGYGCFDLLGQGETYCWPHCESLDDCLYGGNCNSWTGLCSDPVSGFENGEACGTSLDCKGSCTFWPQAPNDGYCVSRCMISSGVCPEGSICSDIYEGARGDLGFCLAACENVDDCRDGFDCADNPYGNGFICLP